MPDIKLTPGEELVMEVLAARWRLGERIWTFSTTQNRWLVSLEQKGLISTMHGIVENTARASLTEEGKKYYWDEAGFVPACGQVADKPTVGEEPKTAKQSKDREAKLPKELVKLVPKKWAKSKKKKHRRLANYVHAKRS